jgi:hypothetical protein
LSVTIAASGVFYTITRATGDWLADDFYVGNVVRLTGAGLAPANVGNNVLIASFMNVYDNFSFTQSDGGVEGYWNGQWNAVARCNQVISNVPKITMNETLKARLIAEAKFLRAYFYFNLVRIYGGVPIFDGIPSDFNYNIPRSTKEEVYAFIEKDLSAAADILPVSYGPTDLGRATKGAAKGLLSKVYLYEKKWQKAFDTSNDVINMGYDLDPDFNHLFRIAGEFGKESVFEVDCDRSYRTIVSIPRTTLS